MRLELVIRHGNRGGVERVGLDNIGAGVEILNMNIGDQVGTCQAQHVVAAFKITGVIRELSPAERFFVELVRLNHRTHRAVEDGNAAGQYFAQLFFRVGHQLAFFLFPFAGRVARATKISTGRLPLRANFSPAKEPVNS